jgi:O-antigen ligase
MMKRETVFRSYIVLLMAFLAVDVNLFPMGVLSVTSLPLSLPAVFVGAAFPLYFRRDFLRFAREHRALLVIVLLFFLSGLVSVALSPFPGIYGLKLLFQYGAFLGVSFLLLFLFSLDRGLGAFFLRTVAGIALFLAVVALIESVDADVYRFLADTFRYGEYQIVDGRGRVGATLSHSNVFGCFMSLGILLFVHLKKSSGMKAWVFLPAVLLLCIAMVLSGSRNAAIVLLVPAALLLFNRKTAKEALAVLFLGVFLLAVLTPSAARFTDLWKIASGRDWPVGGRAAVAVPGEGNTAATRFLLWQSGLRMFLDRPLFGIGPGGCNLAMKDYAPEPLLAVEREKIDRGYLHTHNGFLNILAEFGAAGTAAGLAGFFHVLVPLVRRYGVFPPAPVHALLLGIVLSFVPDAFFYSRFYMVLGSTLFLLFAFQGEARPRSAPPSQEKTAP